MGAHRAVEREEREVDETQGGETEWLKMGPWEDLVRERESWREMESFICVLF